MVEKQNIDALMELAETTQTTLMLTPPGTYWRAESDGTVYFHRVDAIEITLSGARTKCTSIMFSAGSKVDGRVLYSYSIMDQHTISTSQKIDPIDVSEWMNAWNLLDGIINEKHVEMFEKQCLFSNITETPFDDFDVLNDAILLTNNTLYFTYRPNEFCVRIFSIDMHKYCGEETFVEVMHWHLERNGNFYMLNAYTDAVLLKHILRDYPVYPITKYQFDGLFALISTKPKIKEEITNHKSNGK